LPEHFSFSVRWRWGEDARVRNHHRVERMTDCIAKTCPWNLVNFTSVVWPEDQSEAFECFRATCRWPRTPAAAFALHNPAWRLGLDRDRVRRVRARLIVWRSLLKERS
jgi:hypothetical protein